MTTEVTRQAELIRDDLEVASARLAEMEDIPREQKELSWMPKLEKLAKAATKECEEAKKRFEKVSKELAAYKKHIGVQ